jgi:hypothetical protein
VTAENETMVACSEVVARSNLCLANFQQLTLYISMIKMVWGVQLQGEIGSSTTSYVTSVAIDGSIVLPMISSANLKAVSSSKSTCFMIARTRVDSHGFTCQPGSRSRLGNSDTKVKLLSLCFRSTRGSDLQGVPSGAINLSFLFFCSV